MATALELVDLGHLVSQLNRSARWDRELALDEQQRLALARALLHRPAWLVMDEAASAIVPAERNALYRLLHRDVVDMAIIAFEPDANACDDFLSVVHLVRDSMRPATDRTIATPV